MVQLAKTYVCFVLRGGVGGLLPQVSCRAFPIRVSGHPQLQSDMEEADSMAGKRGDSALGCLENVGSLTLWQTLK